MQSPEIHSLDRNSLDRIRIVLVEPAGARNVGSIARVMANMGLSDLSIVNPQCDWSGEEAQHMAVRGRGILAAAQIVEDLPTALTGCQRVVASTHREDLPTMPETPAQALAWLWEVPGNSAIVFGREDCGLTNQELDFGQRYLRIPVSAAYTSLNLAQAVGICAYELHQLAMLPPSPQNLSEQLNSLPPNFAAADQLDRYCQQLEALLLKVGYLLPETAPKRMSKLRRIANRAALSADELALLWGISSQINWKLNRSEEIVKKS
jgi:tRNA/rRNA methyltransferase